jgi:hypothetical protein
MATPHIVGLISVMKSFDSSLNTEKIKKLFRENNITASYENGKYIAGFPDVEKIISSLVSPHSVSPKGREVAIDL